MGKTNLTNNDREQILHFLLQHHKNNRLKKSAVTMAVAHFGISRSTVQRIWSTAKGCLEKNAKINVSFKKKGNCGRKQIERTEKIAIETVNKAFQDVSINSADNVFLSLQMAMNCIMNSGGSNNYKLKHMSKEKLRREGRLPVSIDCSMDAINAAKSI